MRTRVLPIIFLLLISITLVSAMPPLQTNLVGDLTLTLEVPIIENHYQGSSFKFHVHAYNTTNGKLIPQGNINYCNIHVYTPVNGGHEIEANMTPDGNGVDFEYEAAGGNFTEAGGYAAVFYCEVDPAIEERGGFFEHAFMIEENKSVETVETSESIMYLSILGLLLLLLAGSLAVVILVPYGNHTMDTRKGKAVMKVSKLKYLKIMAIWLSYGLFLLLIVVMTGMVNNYIQFVELRTMFTNIYRFFFLLGYGVTTAVVWFTFANVWNDIILNKVILREGKALLKNI